MRKRLFLLGGSGFIGQSLVRGLKETGARHKYQVVIYDPKPPRFFQPDLYLRGRIEAAEKLRRAVKPGDILIHLVHTTIPSDSMDAPGREAKENFEPTVRLIESLKEKRIAGLIYFSTGGTIYGEPKPRKPILEDAAPKPNSFYALAKLLMEDAVKMAGRLGWFKYLILRPSNPFGPFQEELNRHGSVGKIFQALSRNEKFVIFGKGNTIRDFIYIDDLISALVLLMGKEEWNQVFNLGSGKGTSLRELIRLCEKASGKRLKKIYQPIRKTDLKYNVLDCSRLRRLGWKPETDLEPGLKKTWKYFKAK